VPRGVPQPSPEAELNGKRFGAEAVTLPCPPPAGNSGGLAEGSAEALLLEAFGLHSAGMPRAAAPPAGALTCKYLLPRALTLESATRPPSFLLEPPLMELRVQETCFASFVGLLGGLQTIALETAQDDMRSMRTAGETDRPPLVSFETLGRAIVLAESGEQAHHGTDARFPLLDVPEVPSLCAEPPLGPQACSISDPFVKLLDLQPLVRPDPGPGYVQEGTQPTCHTGWVESELCAAMVEPGEEAVTEEPRSPGNNLRVCIPLGGSEMHVPVLPSLISVSWNVSDLKVLDERPEGTAALAAGEAASAAAVREHAEVLLVADLSGGDGAMLEVPTVQRVSNVSLQEMVFVVSPIAVAHTKALLDWSPITSRKFLHRGCLTSEAELHEEMNLASHARVVFEPPMSGADALRRCAKSVPGYISANPAPASETQLPLPEQAPTQFAEKPVATLSPGGGKGLSAGNTAGCAHRGTCNSAGDLLNFRAAHVVQPACLEAGGVSVPGNVSHVTVSVTGTPLDLLQKLQFDHNMLLAQTPTLMETPLGDGFILKSSIDAMGLHAPLEEEPVSKVASACVVLRQVAVGMLEYGIRFAHLCLLHQMEINPELLETLNRSKNGTLRQLAAAYESVESGALIDTGKLVQLKRLITTIHTLQAQSKTLLVSETVGMFTIVPTISAAGVRFAVLEPDEFFDICEPQYLEPFLCNADVVVLPPEIFEGERLARCAPLLRMCTHMIQYCSACERTSESSVVSLALSSGCAVFTVESTCKGKSMCVESREVAQMLCMYHDACGNGTHGVVAAGTAAPPPESDGRHACGTRVGAGVLQIQLEAGFEPEGGSPPHPPQGTPRTPSQDLNLFNMDMPSCDVRTSSGEVRTSSLTAPENGAAAHARVVEAPFVAAPQCNHRAARSIGRQSFAPEWNTPLNAPMVIGGGMFPHGGPEPCSAPPPSGRLQLWRTTGRKRPRAEADELVIEQFFEQFRREDRSALMKRKMCVNRSNQRGLGSRQSGRVQHVAVRMCRSARAPQSGLGGTRAQPWRPPFSPGLTIRDSSQNFHYSGLEKTGSMLPRAYNLSSSATAKPVVGSGVSPSSRFEQHQVLSGDVQHAAGLPSAFASGQKPVLAEEFRFEELPDGTHCVSYDGLYEGVNNPPRETTTAAHFQRSGVTAHRTPRAASHQGLAVAEGPQESRLYSGSLPPLKAQATGQRVSRRRFQR